jgi:hypothetical protein
VPAVASQALLSHRRTQSPFEHPEALLRAPRHHGPPPVVLWQRSDQKFGVDLSQFHSERRSVSVSIDDSSEEADAAAGFHPAGVRQERGMQAVCGTVLAA